MSPTRTIASWSTAEITARSSSSVALRRSRVGPRSGSAWLAIVRSALAAQAFDRCAAGSELGFEPFVTAIEMIDAIDDGLAFSGKASEHQRHRGALIGRHHRRAGELGDAADRRRRALDGDVGAHAVELGHVHETVLEDRFGD